MKVKLIVSRSITSGFTQSGFSLVEILVTLLITSLISGAIFSTWWGIQKAGKSIGNYDHIYHEIVQIKSILYNDLSGIIAPLSRPLYDEKEKKEAPKAKQELKSEASATDNKAKQEVKEKPKKLTHLFYATERNGMLGELTFITSNPTKIYWGDRTGKAKPYVARVLYRLEREESKGPESYMLVRQEEYTLDMSAFKKDAEKKIKSYTLAKGIRSLAMIFYQESFITPQEETAQSEKKPLKDQSQETSESAQAQKLAQNKKEQKKKPEKKVEELKSWDSDKEKEQENVYVRPTPSLIKVSIALWDNAKKKSRNFVFTIPIDAVPFDKKTLADRQKIDFS